MTRPSRRRSRWRWPRRVVAGLITLLLLALGGAAALVWTTLPAADAEAAIPGLSAPVAISLDAHGIPRIAAATETDAAAAIGWLHARDRMFQMELMRRTASGRLAELAGTPVLRLDRLMRTLGLARSAVEDLAALPPDSRAMLDAYATGVNAWIVARGRLAAPEFLVLGAPEPWRPEHSLLWGKLMGVWLSGNWRSELERARLAGVLPPDRLDDLWPPDDSPGRPDLAAVDPTQAARTLAALPRFPEFGTLPASASNAWAVTGARSASGAPLLASDPHLGFSAPILWYLARIDLADGRVLAGATSPGVPMLVKGRTRDLAWGFTTVHSDTQDLFVERLEGTDAYATPDGPRPFAVTEETIAVRGAEPVVVRVRSTRHGPVISDLGEAVAAAPAGTVLAVAAANLAPGDTSATGLLALNRARTLEAARAAAAAIVNPSQNMVVAERGGGIALYLTGRTPVRASGDGTAPVPGWDGRADWTGWVPFEALPHVERPASGAVANANNRVSPPGHPVFLSSDWSGDWRFRRVVELLGGAATQHTATDFVAMQGDVVSLQARELLPLLRELPRPGDGTAARAWALLGEWDGAMRPDLAAPLIYNAWLDAFGRAALAAGGVPEGAWDPSAPFVRLILSLPERGAIWCGAAGCPALAAAMFDRAVARLAAEHGADPAGWRWGGPHVARFEHPVLRAVPVLGRLLRLEAPTGGDDHTISRGGMSRGFAHVHGAGLRLVADLADTDATLVTIATGQSGHPLSSHWGDLLPRWRDNAPLRLTREPETVRGRIVLRPRTAAGG